MYEQSLHTPSVPESISFEPPNLTTSNPSDDEEVDHGPLSTVSSRYAGSASVFNGQSSESFVYDGPSSTQENDSPGLRDVPTNATTPVHAGLHRIQPSPVNVGSTISTSSFRLHRVVRVDSTDEAAAVITQLRRALSRTSSVTPNASTPLSALKALDSARSGAASVVSEDEWHTIQAQAIRSTRVLKGDGSNSGHAADDDSQFYAGLMADAPVLQSRLTSKGTPRDPPKSPVARAQEGEPKLSEGDSHSPDGPSVGDFARAPTDASPRACEGNAGSPKVDDRGDSSDSSGTCETNRAQEPRVKIDEDELQFYRKLMGAPAGQDDNRQQGDSREAKSAEEMKVTRTGTMDGVGISDDVGRVDAHASRLGSSGGSDRQLPLQVSRATDPANSPLREPPPRGRSSPGYDLSGESGDDDDDDDGGGDDDDDDIDWSEVTRGIEVDILRRHREEVTGVKEESIGLDDDGLALSDEEFDPTGVRIARRRQKASELPTSGRARAQVDGIGTQSSEPQRASRGTDGDTTKPKVVSRSRTSGGDDMGLDLSDDEPDVGLRAGFRARKRAGTGKRGRRPADKGSDTSTSSMTAHGSGAAAIAAARFESASGEPNEWVMEEYRRRLERVRKHDEAAARLSRPTAAHISRTSAVHRTSSMLPSARDDAVPWQRTTTALSAGPPSKPPRANAARTAPVLPRPSPSRPSAGVASKLTSLSGSNQTGARAGRVSGPSRNTQILVKPGQRLRVAAPRRSRR